MSGDTLSSELSEFFEKVTTPVLAKPFGIEDVQRVLALLQERSDG
jgi:hypothetical protein